ncbi:MAG: aldose epimerase family protein, partial [Bacteroidota bacterium]
KFSLDGQDYSLFANVGDNNLHGGKVGFDKRIWTAESFEERGKVGVAMRLTSVHLEEGFPGNVSVEVRFSVDANHTLLIEYEASTDQATPFTVTNHSYFNLTGFAESNEGHEVQIQAGHKLAMDDTGAATGEVVALDGAVDDLRSGQTIAAVHRAMGTGFEHYYVFDKEEFGFAPVATITAPHGGLSLEVATSEPGMLFYSGMYTSDELARENGQRFGKYRAFCCETHRYPNGPNLPASPKSILQPGESYQSKTSFTFHLPSAPEA